MKLRIELKYKVCCAVDLSSLSLYFSLRKSQKGSGKRICDVAKEYRSHLNKCDLISISSSWKQIACDMISYKNATRSHIRLYINQIARYHFIYLSFVLKSPTRFLSVEGPLRSEPQINSCSWTAAGFFCGNLKRQLRKRVSVINIQSFHEQIN